MKKVSLKDEGDESEGAGSISSSTGGAAAAPSDRSSPVPAGDVKWRNEFATKIAQARKTVEAEYDPEASEKVSHLEYDDESAVASYDSSGDACFLQVDEIFNDFVSKMEKVWVDSAKVNTKSQKTECEKKIEKLVKTAVKQLKEVSGRVKLTEGPNRGESQVNI